MAKKNIKLIIIGVISIFIAIMSAVATFYFLEVKPELASRENAGITKLDVQKMKIEKRAKVIQSASQEKQPVQNSKAAQKNEMSLKSLVKKAETVYGNEEKSRREGLLWVDAKSSKIMVTLGAVHGLLPGRNLSVYDRQDKIGQVMVETLFDVTAYVRPQKNTPALTQGNYYRVVIE